MDKRLITLVAHTHWDREWYEPFEVFRGHLLEVLDEALDALEHDERIHFTLDGQVALVDDYLQMRPEHERRIRELVAAGRLHVGPWYTQADTLLTDGEALIRNLVFGIRRARSLGAVMPVGYMPDQFGHAAQMPQLLRLVGIDGAVLWRGVGPERPPHAFRWRAPDGSTVTTSWLQDGYGSGRRLPSDPEGFVAAVGRSLERLGDWLGDSPLVIPVGDDHSRLPTWLPDAAAALERAHPELEVRSGSYGDHLSGIKPVDDTIVGELRSPAFAPVLAGTASARIREKQAAHRATQLLLRQAEPLAAWVAALGGTPPRALLDRAWRLLVLNHAHDSAAGCGGDATHADVQGRYRRAEQLAAVARDQAIAKLSITVGERSPEVVAFVSGPDHDAVLVETDIPRSIDGPVVAVGPDEIARPIQLLSSGDEPPLFEGELSAADLSQHLGGLDPSTPIFGRFLAGITARADGDGRVRLDVGLADAPVPRRRLEADQARIATLLETTERFKIVLHASAPTRRALLQAGPARENALVPIALRLGDPDARFLPARRLEGVTAGIGSGPISVVAAPDGSVLIRDAMLPLGEIRANDLVDEGDRGDLYHFDPIGDPIRPRAASATVVESGPLRARLRIEQELLLPRGLTNDRRQRGVEVRSVVAISEVTLMAGERRIEFSTSLMNEVEDHRLRALVHLPGRAERLDVEHGLAVIARPFEAAAALGAGIERAAPTGQHHLFADVSNGKTGLALMSRGLPEHEAVRGTEDTTLALTLLRSVGWLSRGDLSVIDHAAGPMLPTPGAQELGPHRFEYALLLHEGEWRSGGVLAEARRYAVPPIAIHPKGTLVAPAVAALVRVAPASSSLLALYPAASGEGLVARVLHTGADDGEVVLRPSWPIREAQIVNPLEEPTGEPRAEVRAGEVHLWMRPWQIASVLFR